MKVRPSVKRICDKCRGHPPARPGPGDLLETRATSSVRDRKAKEHMARIAGVDLPRDKRLDIALRYIYGIGPTRAYQIVEGTGIDGGRRSATSPRKRSCRSASSSTGTTRSRVTSGARSRRTSSGRSRSAATRASATAGASRCAASARTRTRARARARRRPSRARRSSSRRSKGDHDHMAKPKAKKTKRREKKNVMHGQAHIKSTFNNTIVTITDLQGNTLAGRAPATSGSRAPGSPRRSPRSSPPRRPPAPRRSTACRRWTCS